MGERARFVPAKMAMVDPAPEQKAEALARGWSSTRHPNTGKYYWVHATGMISARGWTVNKEEMQSYCENRGKTFSQQPQKKVADRRNSPEPEHKMRGKRRNHVGSGKHGGRGDAGL